MIAPQSALRFNGVVFEKHGDRVRILPSKDSSSQAKISVREGIGWSYTLDGNILWHGGPITLRSCEYRFWCLAKRRLTRSGPDANSTYHGGDRTVNFATQLDLNEIDLWRTEAFYKLCSCSRSRPGSARIVAQRATAGNTDHSC